MPRAWRTGRPRRTSSMGSSQISHWMFLRRKGPAGICSSIESWAWRRTSVDRPGPCTASSSLTGAGSDLRGTNMPAASREVMSDCGSTLSSDPRSGRTTISCPEPKEATSLPAAVGPARTDLALGAVGVEALGETCCPTRGCEAAGWREASDRVALCSTASLRSRARSSKIASSCSWEVLGHSFRRC
jgi:hypothetical protein